MNNACNLQLQPLVDFATVFYNSATEVELLKLQCMSLSRLGNLSIGNIIIFYNDQIDEDYHSPLSHIRDDLLPYCPEHLQEKLKIYCWRDISYELNPLSNWYSQQAAKLQLATLCSSPYYVSLDAKNHFIKHVSANDFFSDNGVPFLRLQRHGVELTKFYEQCLSYFDCINPFENDIFCTAGTPFVFNRQAVVDLLHCILEKEGLNILDFIANSKKYTEFFLYFAYLCSTCSTHLHQLEYNVRFAGFGSADPSCHSFNTIDHLCNILDDHPLCKTIALHRCYPQYLSDHDREMLITKIYSKHFGLTEISQLRKVLDLRDFTTNAYPVYGLPSNFVASEYKDLNPDLLHLTDGQAIQHYRQQGVNECRIFSR